MICKFKYNKNALKRVNSRLLRDEEHLLIAEEFQ